MPITVAEGPAVATGYALDATDAAARAALIAKHDLVISMLPAFMHMDVLKDCLTLKKHVITPSYVPDALWSMDAEFKAAGLTVLNEMGLDPGIDHMSAMRILDRIRAEGGRMEAFESYCGGLMAPESDDNPWGYKFSWNPRNVILAGQGGAAKYIRGGETKYIPYHKLFQQTVRVAVEGFGEFDGYANRDSLKYRSHYGLDGILEVKDSCSHHLMTYLRPKPALSHKQTFLKLQQDLFCKAESQFDRWQAVVKDTITGCDVLPEGCANTPRATIAQQHNQYYNGEALPPGNKHDA